MKRRNADYNLLKVTENFEVIESIEHETSGNIQWDVAKYRGKENLYLYESVTSPMFLARLISLFDGLKINCHGQSAYKITWSACLRLKGTDLELCFYDYKGAASIGSTRNTKNEDEAKLVSELLDVLCNDRCPHPYDDCVVGEVA